MSRGNNFDLLRLVFASIVMLVHLHALSAEPTLAFLSVALSSELAVEGFFVISGYLVVMSYERSTGLKDYWEKRIRRIYPAYAAVVLGCGLLGWLITASSTAEYFSGAWLRQVAANLVFLNFLAPELPGVFADNPWHAVNGALWTIKLEVGFYIIVPLLVWFARSSRPWVVIGLVYVASVLYPMLLERVIHDTGKGTYQILARQLPGQLAYFAIGAAAWWYRSIPRRRMLMAMAIALPLLMFMPAMLQPIFRPLALGVVVIGAAVALPRIGNAGRYGDFSYGIYIMHFPVIQVLVSEGWFRAAPFAASAASVAFVVAAAWLSWNVIERPMLKASSHYVKAVASPASAPS